jgi:hypothetical protein
MTEQYKEIPANITKPHLSAKVINWVWVFAMISSLILTNNDEAQANDTTSLENRWEEQSEFYNAFRNEMFLSINWFIGKIITKNPDLSYRTLRNKELIVVDTLINKSGTKKLYFPYILSKENIESIEWISNQLIYLLDSMYWEWYCKIFDWKDHSDKALIIDISPIKKSYRLRNLSIIDVEQNNTPE